MVGLTRRRFLTASLLAAVVLASATTGAVAQEPDGEEVYQANCSGCHQPDGTGAPGLFPPLKGNPSVADSGYLREVIRNGLEGTIEVLGETYDGAMPALPGLSDAEVDAVIAFVQGDLQEMDAVTSTTAAVTVIDLEGIAFEEAAARGEQLFGGWERLENGGPACIACHTAGRFTGLGGPTLGPDLDAALDVFGGLDGLRSAIASLHPGRMAELYDSDPLSQEEQTDLTAFLARAADTKRGGPFPDGLVMMGLGGLLLLAGFAAARTIQTRRSTEDKS